MRDTIRHMEFRESLPANCPPPDAVDVAYDGIYRFVSSNPPDDSEFASHAAQGRSPPESVDPCRWASCSFFSKKESGIKRLPKVRVRFRFVARLNFPEGSGLSKEKAGHIEFWFFKAFDPCSAIVGTEAI